MTDSGYDVVGIGNAIVDVLTHADDGFLEDNALVKGTMALIDAVQADAIYARMGSGIEVSGGSAANTMAGLASLGSRCAFIGKVKNDQLGTVFRHDIRAMGVDFETNAAVDGPSTARCLIMVTPDAQRTMQTYLGASVELEPADVADEVIAGAGIVYLEGYLWDPPLAKEAFRKAARIAEAAGAKVALSLSDPFCVHRHRADFLELVDNHVDILFANEEEIKYLYKVEDFDTALQHVRGHCEVAALTRGDKGSIIVAGDEVHVIDPAPLERAVDTTGAGDLYAAGFLHGLSTKQDLARCGLLGSLAAAEVIGHFGARPETGLAELVKARLG